MSPASASGAIAAHERFRATRQFGSLDGLRAVSILAVIWHHAGSGGFTSPILQEGKQGVALFFAISGFLIVTLILRAKQSATGFQIPQFWGRRMLRIFPVYYAVLLCYVVLAWGLERHTPAGRAFFDNLPYFLSFASNWHVAPDEARVIFFFAWSLAAEEQFYLVWPVVERYLENLWPLVLAVVALVATRSLSLGFADTVAENFGLKMIASVPPAILVGVILAHLLHRRRSFALLWKIGGRRWSAAAAAALSGVALLASPSLGPAAEILFACSFGFLVCTCVIREDHSLVRQLTVRALTTMGVLSYGMYLLHMLAINVARRVGFVLGLNSPLFVFAGGVVLTVALAALAYVTYERFFIRMKDRWFPSVMRPVAPGVQRAASAGLSSAQATSTA